MGLKIICKKRYVHTVARRQARCKLQAVRPLAENKFYILHFEFYILHLRSDQITIQMSGKPYKN